jgi:uncharacterized protein (DUF927 family)
LPIDFGRPKWRSIRWTGAGLLEEGAARWSGGAFSVGKLMNHHTNLTQAQARLVAQPANASDERLALAREHRDSGLSLAPIGPRTKWPPIKWETYQKRQPTDAELRTWVEKYPGLGIVGGKVSGHRGEDGEAMDALEILDIEAIAKDLIKLFCELVEKAAPRLLERLPRVKTPTEGCHIYYRCETVEGNQKLAQRAEEVTIDDLPHKDGGALNSEAVKKLGIRRIGDRYFKIRTLIETRGEGGQVLSPLCLPGTHPNGGVYVLTNGDLRNIPTITTKERDILLNAARACNEFVEPTKAKGAREAEREKIEGLQPGADYNSRSDVFEKSCALLEEYGWTLFRRDGLGELWSRPGVDDHCSGRLFNNGALYVFSTNASPFDAGETYSPFAIYSELKHGGKYSASAKALAAAGYGDRRKASKAGTGPRTDRPQPDEEEGKFAAGNADDKETSACVSIPDLELFEGKLKLRFKRLPRGEVNVEVEIEGALIHQDQVSLPRAAHRARLFKKIAKHVSLAEDQSAEIEKGLLDKSKEIEKLIEEESKKERKKEKPKSGPASTKEVGNIDFEVNERGVWATEENGSNTWVCSQLVIEADTRDERNENWGRLLRFPDRDGVWHTWSMPMELLGGDGREFRQSLLNQGLDIGGRKSRALLEAYLNVKPDKRALCVTRPGWHRGGFVLPDEFIGGQDAEPIYLQTFTAKHLFRQSGSADEWREKLGVFCRGNKRLVFSVSFSFSAPLLDPLQGESGGLHFTGNTSEGKSTTLYVAGSVHGGGGDKGFLRRWRATINGLESVAEAHHDSLLCLDEIAECKPEDVNEAAYMLSNGQGKARQARAGGLRGTPEWRTVFLSSGEISLADHIAQSGRRVRGGQEVRVVNLPADAGKGFGLFEDLHGKRDGDEFARYLQKASREYYGAPIRSFLRHIVGRLDELRSRYKTFSEEVLKDMLPDTPIGAVSRVAHRFALAAFAGELATEIGLTGWEPEEATDAAKALFQTWLDARGTSGSTDEEAAVRQVRAFLEQHGSSRFQRLRHPVKVDSKGVAATDEENLITDDRAVINRAGFVKPDNAGDISEYFIAPEVFRGEVCKGFDYRMVARALQSRALLISDKKPDCLTRRQRTPEGSLGFYCVSTQIHEKG